MIDYKDIVFSNLDATKDNGYDEFLKQSAQDIAYDMLAYAADCEDIDDISLLVSHIEEWQRENL